MALFQAGDLDQQEFDSQEYMEDTGEAAGEEDEVEEEVEGIEEVEEDIIDEEEEIEEVDPEEENILLSGEPEVAVGVAMT